MTAALLAVAGEVQGAADNLLPCNFCNLQLWEKTSSRACTPAGGTQLAARSTVPEDLRSINPTLRTYSSIAQHPCHIAWSRRLAIEPTLHSGS